VNKPQFVFSVLFSVAGTTCTCIITIKARARGWKTAKEGEAEIKERISG